MYAEEDYAGGSLGPVFSRATPLSLPLVAELLRTVAAAGGGGRTPEARELSANCRAAVETLAERSGRDATAQQLCRMRLELDLEGGGGAPNAHLAGMTVDAEGNLVMAEEAGGGQEQQPQQQAERMRPYEAVALCTLMPGTVEEAWQLLPSLRRFSERGVAQALAVLDHDF